MAAWPEQSNLDGDLTAEPPGRRLVGETQAAEPNGGTSFDRLRAADLRGSRGSTAAFLSRGQAGHGGAGRAPGPSHGAAARAARLAAGSPAEPNPAPQDAGGAVRGGTSSSELYWEPVIGCVCSASYP
jgi:hypothetical protein